MPDKETREAWLKTEISLIKLGATIRMRCVMATEDRLVAGLCKGDIPEDRAHRGSNTCSELCQRDRRRLLRWEKSKNKCRFCGHGLTAKQKRDMAKQRAGNERETNAERLFVFTVPDAGSERENEHATR
jgi:hypothetical protein